MDAIEERLWTLTTVLFVVVAIQATILVMAIVGGYHKRKQQKFVDLWRQGQLDELIDRSRATLKKEPNNVNALLYGAKALRKNGKLGDARLWFERALESEPAFKPAIDAELEFIRKKEAGPLMQR
jgi:tetratricopeptide (TPR) repeat protein